MRLFLLLVVGRFFGFVILVCVGNEFDSTEKPQHTLQVLGIQLDHVCGKGCVQLIFFGIHIPGHKETRGAQGSVFLIHLRFGRGWDNSLCGACPRLRLARSEISFLLRCMREVM